MCGSSQGAPPCMHGEGSSMVGANQADIADPADTLAMWEHNSSIPMCDFLEPSNWFAPPPKDRDLQEHFHMLHRSGANTIWCDWHARRMVYGALRRPMFSCRKDIYPSE